MLEFVKIYLAETNLKLSKKGQTYCVINSKTDFAGGGGRIIDGSFS